MEKVDQPRYCKLKQKNNNMIHLTPRVYHNKEGGELQHKAWKFGRQEETTIKQHQHDKATDLQQVKV